MKRASVRIILIVLGLLALPCRMPAPLIFRPGEGWVYETPGGEGGWRRARAKDQLDVAQQAFDKKDFGLAMKAARRTVRTWPLSDYAPQAQYLVGRCYEAKKADDKAFKEYQKLIEKYPKIASYNEVLERQYEIATRFLGGQWFKLWGVVPFFPSMDKTAAMYEKIIKSGPYAEVAPRAQMNIAAAREKQSDYPLAVKAYERAADRYNDKREIASEALFKSGLAYQKQAQTSEYDQSVAVQAVSTFSDFITLYPADNRIPEARRIIGTLKSEQARGSFKVAQFYEKGRHNDAALIYYNEVLLQDPESALAGQARQRIDALKNHSK